MGKARKLTDRLPFRLLQENLSLKATTIASWESLFRPLLTQLPPEVVVSQYSQGRLLLVKRLKEEIPPLYIPPRDLSRTIWGITFRGPLFNAAGMFKNGECYPLIAGQGAAAYLGGTSTWNPREGNRKEGISLPFAPYPRSHAASNWLGLPNDGDRVNSRRVQSIQRLHGCPLGWSVMASPTLEGEEQLRRLVEGMWLYEKAGVDFLEINESCPNTERGKPQDSGLKARLLYIREQFLEKRQRRVPVIIKFSADTELSQIPELVDLLLTLGFDGVNFGNASTNYQQHRNAIDEKEVDLFDYFITTFGGGISGKPLQKVSLLLAAAAVQHVRKRNPGYEFRVIRTGGIESWKDIEESEKWGIALNQWFTGYFENFAQHGHAVYREIMKGI